MRSIHNFVTCPLLKAAGALSGKVRAFAMVETGKPVTAGRAAYQIPVVYVPFVNRKHFAISRPQAPVFCTAGLSLVVNFQIHTARQEQAAARATPSALPLSAGKAFFYMAGIEQA
jgi:hypothetical protein